MRLAAVIAVVLATAPAVAETPVPSRARELAHAGRVFHDARDYPRAIAAFQAAYALAPSPGLLFDLAQSYRLSGDCPDAAWMYRRYLATDPTDPGRELATAHLHSLAQCDHAAQLTAGATGSALTDDDSPGQTERTVGIGLAAGGAVLLASAAWFAVDAHDASEAVSAAYAKGGKWSDIAATNARGERSAQLGTVLGISGGLAVVAATVCYGLGYRAEHVGRFAVIPTAHGGAATASWSW